MKRTTPKWFTLIEMLIVIIIIWILAVVLIESYLTVSKIALKVEQEKNLSEESLLLTQIFQSISDEATIDYDRYNYEDLRNSEWFTSVLYLTGEEWSGTTIYTSGNCLELDWNFTINDDWNFEQDIKEYSWCSLILKQWEREIPITLPGKVIISKVMFKVIPYNSDEDYFEDAKDWDTLINNLHQPAFWMFIHLYSPFYQPKWINKIDQSLQLFFNLKL